jgi:hypothetical protein
VTAITLIVLNWEIWALLMWIPAISICVTEPRRAPLAHNASPFPYKRIEHALGFESQMEIQLNCPFVGLGHGQ